jgi:hypothetical protein
VKHKKPLEVITVTQAALSTGFSMSSAENLIQDLTWGKMIWFVVAGLGLWAFKKDWIGITTFGPYDRGFRELFGRPGRLLGQGPHPHIIGLGNLRRASVANATVLLSNRVSVQGRVYLYKFQLVIHIVDKREQIYAAIYETFDEGKKDQYNAQRIAYVMNTIEEVIRDILETTGDCSQVTVEAITRQCGDHLLLMCGTAITKVMNTEFTPVDAQILKDGMLEGERTGAVLPFPQQQQTA